MNEVKNKKSPKTKEYLRLLDSNGYFARQVVLDGVLGILAQKSGKALLICTAWHEKHDNDQTFKEFENTGGRSICVNSLKDLEYYITTGVER